MNNNSIRLVNQYVLEQMQSGHIPKKDAVRILETLNTGNGNERERIAIIGMQCRFPCAADKWEYWDNIIHGVDCVKAFSEDRAKDIFGEGHDIDLKRLRGGYLDNIASFDHAFFRIPPREAAIMEPYQRLLMEVAHECIEDAGYGNGKIANTCTGVYVGVDTTNKSQYRGLIREKELLSLVGSLNSIIASRIPYFLNMSGPAVLLDTACSSGLTALHLGCSAICRGECEMALAAGIHLTISPDVMGITSGLTSTDLETRAFDHGGTGFAWGEGVGILLLKRLDDAIRDHDHIYAVIRGSAVNNDGTSNGITAPNPKAHTDVIRKAWKKAGIRPDEISYIEAHGTGTELGDPIEIKGITDAFARTTSKKQFCALGSVKTNIGHTVGASGIASVIKVAMGFRHGIIPPSLHFNRPNDRIQLIDSPVYINTKPREWRENAGRRIAGINAFGISGTNCHVVLQAFDPEKKSGEGIDTNDYIFTLSAMTQPSLKAYINRYITYLESQYHASLRNICYTGSSGRDHANYRLAICTQSVAQLIGTLETIRDRHLVDNLPPSPLAEPLAFHGSKERAGHFFLGYHVLLSGNKQKTQEGQLSYHEKKQLDRQADEVVGSPEENLSGRAERICGLYVKGADIDWEKVYHGIEIRKVPLPVYPFEPKKCWPDIRGIQKPEPRNKEGSPYFKTVWQEALIPSGTDKKSQGCVLLFANRQDSTVESGVRKTGRRVISILLGNADRMLGEDRYWIKHDNESSYRNLFQTIKGSNPIQIILAGTFKDHEKITSLQDIDDTLNRGMYCLYYVVRAIAAAQIHHPIDVVLLSDHAYRVTGKEPTIKPEHAVLFGFGKAVCLENPNIRCRCIDSDKATPIDCLMAEMMHDTHEYKVAYREGKRYVEELVPVDREVLKENRIPGIVDGGVYLITGGRSGLGLETAKTISRNHPMTLFLVNRSAMPERGDWDQWIREGKEKAVISLIKQIRCMEENGTRVECVTGDISDESFVRKLAQQIKAGHEKLNGIIHCAGNVSRKVIINKSRASIEEVIRPKVHGTWLLHTFTRELQPNFIILFSSIATLLAREGQADYIAANSYLDSFVGYGQNRCIQVINWPVWSETGMGIQVAQTMEKSILRPVSTEEGTRFFMEILQSKMERICVCPIQPKGHFNFSPDQFSVRIHPELMDRFNRKKPGGNEVVHATVTITGRKDNQYSTIEKHLANIWGAVLGCDRVHIQDAFYELGGDSLHAIQVANRVNADAEIGVPIHPGDILKYTSIEACAEFIRERKATYRDEKNRQLQRIDALLREIEKDEVTG